MGSFARIAVELPPRSQVKLCCGEPVVHPKELYRARPNDLKNTHVLQTMLPLAAMPSHPVFMVIGCVTCSHDELNICAPPAATAISITICDETRMWYAHAMVMFRQLQGGCDGEAWWTSFTLCGSQRTLSVTRGSIRTLTSLADCTASAAGSSAASGAASTSRCRAVEQRPSRSLRITTSVQAEPHLF